MSEEWPERRFRTLFISDVHLGARGSQADRLLDFLRSHDADTIYLVGDIVDGWALQSNWYWPQSHNDFVQKMLRKARKGAKVIYVPGNHDEFLRNYYGTHFGGIDVVENTVHTGVDGRRYLVIHGDIFDLVVQNARWLAHLGDKAYDFAIQMNRLVNFFRRAFGVPYWSLSQWAKLKVKNAVNYIGAFEQTLAAEARRHGADGVICGHIHYATIRDEHGIRYMNCGDWVESCTALAEHEDGRFEIITWTDPLRRTVAGRRRRGACRLMRILVATDAWHPQVNGVVRTLTMMAEAAQGARRRGRLSHAAIVPDLRAAELPGSAPGAAVSGENRPPDRAMRGPTAFTSPPKVRSDCWRGVTAANRGLPFTTSFHTRFPEYISARLPIPENWIWAALRAFHGPSQAVMAATPALAGELRGRGFRNVVLWPRGVDAAPVSSARGRSRPAAPGVPLRRPRRGRKEPRGVSRPRSARHQADRRRRAGARFAGAKISASGVPRRAAGRGIGAGLCGRRRLRVSEQDRHVWSRAAGGAGQRPAGRRLSRDRTARRDRRGAGRRVERGFAGACLAALRISPQACLEFAAEHTWEASARAFIENISEVGGVDPASNAAPFAAEAPRFVA